MKVYEDMKGTYIKVRSPQWPKGTEFMVWENDSSINLLKIGSEEYKDLISDGIIPANYRGD